MGRIQGLGLQGVLMHQLVSLVPIHTAVDAFPLQLRAEEVHTLQSAKEGINTQQLQ